MTDDAELAVMANDIKYIRESIQGIKDCMVTQKEFQPFRQIIYGIVGLVLTAVGAGILALVIK